MSPFIGIDLDWLIWVCLKIVYPYTQWFCWSLSLFLWLFHWGYTPFSDISIWDDHTESHIHIPSIPCVSKMAMISWMVNGTSPGLLALGNSPWRNVKVKICKNKQEFIGIHKFPWVKIHSIISSPINSYQFPMGVKSQIASWALWNQRITRLDSSDSSALLELPAGMTIPVQ